MPRYVIHEQVFLRPAQQMDSGEMEPDVIVEITKERAAPLLAKGLISAVPLPPPEKEVKAKEPPVILKASAKKSDTKSKN